MPRSATLPVRFSLAAALLASVLFLVPSARAQSGATVEDMGSGAGWIDVDGDGLIDLVYLTPEGQVNVFGFDAGSGAFTDRSVSAIPDAVRAMNNPALGVTCGDVNNDGYVDMFITMNGPNLLLLNNGDGTFRSAARTAGIKPGLIKDMSGNWVTGDALSSSAAFLDYDNDGLLDIYVGNYMGNANQLFHNTGVDETGMPHFVDVAPALHLDFGQDGESNWTLGVAVADYDNDGDMDIYVANDYNGPNTEYGILNPGDNILFRNNGDGTFTDVSRASHADDPGWAMGVTFGDYDHDGNLDIFLANFWQDALLHNNGDGTFTNVARDAGLVTDGAWNWNGWGTSFIDYDNDGDLDIHVANGYILNDQGQKPNEPNQLWENTTGFSGVTHFKDVSHAAGIDDTGDGRGAAYGDFNHDGFLDLFVINNNFVHGPEVAPTTDRLLYINMKNGTFKDVANSEGIRNSPSDGNGMPSRGDFSQNDWLEVSVRGTVSNRSAIGARVTIQNQGHRWIAELGSGSYCSQNSPYLHFGLGTLTVVDSVVVRFPSGRTAVEKNVPLNQVLTVVEPNQTPVSLLSFAVTGASDGAHIRWQYTDDGDAAAFTVTRTAGGRSTVLASDLHPAGGAGEYLDREAPSGVELTYALDVNYRNGGRERLATRTFVYQRPLAAVIRQNFPNPFASSTAIPVESAPGGAVRVEVFDAAGRLVRRLDGSLPGGGGLLRWDGRDASGRPVPAGTYFYRVEGTTTSLKMIRRPQ